MMIKGMDGNTEHVTSQSQGNLNTFLGGLGTALGIINGGANMVGWGGPNMGRGGYGYGPGFTPGYAPNGYFNSADPNSRLITKAEADLMQENTTLKSDNALLRSEKYTDQKLVEVTTYLDGKINRVVDKFEEKFAHQQEVNEQQIAFNSRATSHIDVLRSQVAQLGSITQLVVPTRNVCETGCGCGCGNS